MLSQLFSIFLTTVVICSNWMDCYKLRKHAAEFQVFHKEWHDAYVEHYPFGWSSFDCNVDENVEEPIDVHHLRPENIKVIAALGDSLTAAQAAKAVDYSEITEEWRGISFAIGRDESVETVGTLANIFSKFNSKLVGGSTGKRSANDSTSGLNVAVSGSTASDMLHQAMELVSRIRSRSDINVDKDWKFINVCVGANDICKICQNFSRFGVDQYQLNIIKAISYLRDNLPLTYVNLIPALPVSFLMETHEYSEFCVDVHKQFCPCLFELSSSNFSRIQKSFFESVSIFYGDAYQSATFAVTVAPVQNLNRIPLYKSSPNFGILALDCFHFSAPMHDAVAKFVWKNLLEPIQNRTVLNETNYILAQFDCPPNHCPYLRTLSNSYDCQIPVNGVLKSKKILMSSTRSIPLPKWSEDTSTFGLGIFGTVLMVMALCVVATIAYLKYGGSRRRKNSLTEKTPLLKIDLFDEEGIF